MSVPSSPADPGSFRPQAGWYQDPSGSPQMRWWDGTRWTNGVAPLAAYTAPPTMPEVKSEAMQPPLGSSENSNAPLGQPGPAGMPGTVPPIYQMPPAISNLREWFKPIEGVRRDKKWWIAIIGGAALFLLAELIRHMGSYSTPYGNLDVTQVHALCSQAGAAASVVPACGTANGWYGIASSMLWLSLGSFAGSVIRGIMLRRQAIREPQHDL